MNLADPFELPHLRAEPKTLWSRITVLTDGFPFSHSPDSHYPKIKQILLRRWGGSRIIPFSPELGLIKISRSMPVWRFWFLPQWDSYNYKLKHVEMKKLQRKSRYHPSGWAVLNMRPSFSQPTEVDNLADRLKLHVLIFVFSVLAELSYSHECW